MRRRGGHLVCGGQLHKLQPASLSAESKRPPFLAAVLIRQRRSRRKDHRVEEKLSLSMIWSENRFPLFGDHALVLGRTGSDLLFQVLRLSTIGAGEFYGRVRDGIGYRPPAKTTSPAKDECEASELKFATLV